MIRIAAFDDFPQFLELLRRELEENDIRDVTFHSDEQDFLEAVVDATDIAIIDNSIKGTHVTGIDLMREVFRKAPYCRVIIISAFLDVPVIERAYNNGAWKVMDKTRDTFFDDLVYFINQHKPILEVEHRLRR